MALLLFISGVSHANAQQTPTPSAQGYRGTGQESLYTGDFSDIAITIDAFWSAHFQTAEVSYTSPGIVPLDQLRHTACGPHGPGSGALYCTLDSTIYLSPFFLAEKDDAVGDYAPITILAHEWGHHVQFLTNAPDPGGNTFELQADCLAGVYTQNAEEQGLLDPGDISEAVTISRDSGDPLGLPQELGLRSHGTNDERITSFMSGYLNGLEACNLPLHDGQTPRSENTDQADLPRQTPTTLSVPNALPLAHAGCFRIESDNALTFDELVARLGGTDEARTQLQNWGWQASANRVFTCDTPPDGEAGWIDISLHLFADAASAQQAVDYFAALRAEGTTLIAVTPPAIGDHAAVVSGPATSGKEFTLYVSQGPLMIRVTGVSSTGIPFINVLTVAQAILALPLPQAQSQEHTPSAEDVAVYLPNTLSLGHASCFRVAGEGTLDFDALVERFPGVPDAESHLQDLGWQAGAYRQFGCDAPPSGHVGWIDIGVHQFQDPASAAAAVPFFASSRALGSKLEMARAPSIGDSTAALTGPASNGTEYTLYMSSGPLLFRITGVAPAGDPAPDVEQVMMGLLAGSITVGQVNAPSAEVLVPPTAIPTVTFIPTATAVPTPTAIPTATPAVTAPLDPVPTPTPLPQPTATTAPTATTVPQPTATPRVVRAPAAIELTPLSTPTVVPSSASCQLVELYPGYPGYRGYVAGIDGPGEVACIGDLIAANPRFDQAAEDAANLAAAQAIGLSGTPIEWTWENWMAIEAERGLVPTCYSCLFLDLDPSPPRESTEWDSTDPRLQMGGYGTSEALTQAAAGAGLGLNSAAFFEDKFDPDDQDSLGPDHVLRAVIGLQWQGHHTAPEMLDAYDQLFTRFSEPGVQFIDLGVLGETVLAQGGYAPTPPTAHIEDQVYMIRTSAEAMCAGMGEDSCSGWLGQYDAVEAAFLSEVLRSGPDVSYAEWIREEVPDLFLF